MTEYGNGSAVFQFSPAGHAGSSFTFSITVSDEFGTDSFNFTVVVLNAQDFRYYHYQAGRDIIGRDVLFASVTPGPGGYGVYGTDPFIVTYAMFGDGSPLSLQGVAHSGGGCAAWLRNGTFAYRFGGSGYFDGWYQPDVWVEGYRTSYAPSLPIDLMSASSAISEAQQKLAEEEDNIQSALDRIEDSLPQWTSRVGEYSKLAKFLNERLEWPNVAQKILEANQKSQIDRVRAFWSGVPVYGEVWGNLGVMGIGTWRALAGGGRQILHNADPANWELNWGMIPGAAPFKFAYDAPTMAEDTLNTAVMLTEGLTMGAANVIEGTATGNQAQIDAGLTGYGEVAGPTLFILATAQGPKGGGLVTDATSSGRIPGRLYGETRLNRLEVKLQKHNAQLVRNADAALDVLPGKPAAAFQVDTATNKAKLLLRSNPTEYEVLHEFQHFRDWRTRAMMNATEYALPPQVVREQFVFDRLRSRPSIWNRFDARQQSDAYNYISSFRGGDPERWRRCK